MTKIPSHAIRVFKGVVFDVYQWEQELFDGSKTTFEMLKRPNTVLVLPIIDGKIAYARQEQPGKPTFLSLFGGRAEEGEEPLETAQRELREETGFVSDDWQLIRRFPFPGKIDWTVYYFVARDCRKTTEPSLDGGEKIEICYASVDTFLTDIVTHPDFMEYELKNEIRSLFNPAAAQQLKKEILGRTEV